MGFFIFIYVGGWVGSEALILLLADGLLRVGLSLGLLAAVGALAGIWAGRDGDSPAWRLFLPMALANLELLLVHFLGWTVAAVANLAAVGAVIILVKIASRGTGNGPIKLPDWYRARFPERAAAIDRGGRPDDDMADRKQEHP